MIFGKGRLLLLVVVFVALASADDDDDDDGNGKRLLKIVCGDTSAKLECAPYARLKIEYAYYGRKDRKTCATGIAKNKLSKTNCRKNVKDIIQKACQDKSECQVSADSAAFQLGNWCSDTYLYLAVSYKCVAEGYMKYACDGKRLSISCSSKKTIRILHGFYGRNRRGGCKVKGKDDRDVTCKAANVAAIIAAAKTKCENKKRCDLDVSTNLFGVPDPCPATSKYAVIRYECRVSVKPCTTGWGFNNKGGSKGGFQYTSDAVPKIKFANEKQRMPFKMVAGLNGDTGTVSFEARGKPGWFIRAYTDKKLYLERKASPRRLSTFKVDSTFKVVNNKFSSGSVSFESVTNSGYFISVSGSHMEIDKPRNKGEEKRAAFEKVCIPATCANLNCPRGSSCRNKGKSPVCMCSGKSQPMYDNSGFLQACTATGLCTASGDPHYRTFDGVKIDYMGTCKYTLAKPCPRDQTMSLTDFNVEVKNEHRSGKTRVSFTRSVDVDVYGYRIRLGQGRKVSIGQVGQVNGITRMVNGSVYTLPVESLAGAPGLRIAIAGKVVSLTTEFGLKVTFDGYKTAGVYVPSSYKNVMCGLCGNYNGNGQDDFKDKLGNPSKNDMLALGNSWQVPDDTEGDKICTPVETQSTGECQNSADRQNYAEPKCRVLKDPSGRFKDCVKKIKQDSPETATEAYDECVFDVCAVWEQKGEMLCAAISKFVDECKEMGFSYNWRTSQFCPLPCANNMEYKNSMSPCQPTCLDPDTDPDECEQEDVEGCQCNSGYVLSGLKCVPRNKCGCRRNDDGKYFSIGDIYQTRDCKKQIKCLEDGSFNETSLGDCHKKAQCTTRDGERRCFCRKGYQGNGITSCTDIDECKSGDHDCPSGTVCKNTRGGFLCDCPKGQVATLGRGGKITCSECSGGFKFSSLLNKYYTITYNRRGSRLVKMRKNQDDNFLQVAGLNGEPLTVSLESQEKPGYFLRVFTDGKVYLEHRAKPRSPTTFDADATFNVAHGRFLKYGITFESFTHPDKYLTYDTRGRARYILRLGTATSVTAKKAASFSRKCVKGKAAKCAAKGDVHYFTFDGKKINFQGVCKYTLVKPCPPAEKQGVPEFNVEVKSTKRPGKKDTVSFLKFVDVDVYGYRIRLDQGGKVIIGDLSTTNGASEMKNSMQYNLPVINLPNAPGLKIEQSGKYVRLTTDFGLLVKFDGDKFAETEVPDIYKNIGMCGLCGNYNGNAGDDFVDSQGVPRTKHADIGNSWEVYDDSGDNKCVPVVDDPPNTCENSADDQLVSGDSMCGIMKDVSGIFGNCTVAIMELGREDDLDEIFDDCHYDLCILKESRREQLCSSLEVLAELCLDVGEPVSWRKSDFCPLPCTGKNMAYSPSMNACPRTCLNKDDDDVACDLPHVEGCECAQGTVLSGKNCVPVNQCGCLKDNMYYPAGASYLSADCSKKFTCKPDGTFDRADIGSCHKNAICEGRGGVKDCYCGPQFTGNGRDTCDDIDECTDPGACTANANCTNTVGSHKCTCVEGYTGGGNSQCVNVDECAKPDACGANSDCNDIDGSYDCECKDGYEGNAKTGDCTDIDECKGPNNCVANAACKNVAGSYTCECLPGFAGNALVECKDIDECQDKSTCHANAICENKAGTADCTCKSGYTGNGKANCDDVDECTQTPSPCAANAECSNIGGSFTCNCKAGYEGNPYKTGANPGCTDKDECDDPSKCGANAICVNNDGGYNCKCKPGFEGNPGPGAGCRDKDECAGAAANCIENAVCENTVGSFECKCADGFNGNAATECKDIDECITEKCADNAVCNNNIGGFTCDCESGYSGDGNTNCTDDDECTRPDICPENSQCKNNAGSFVCQCDDGFVKNQVDECEDSDECTDGSHKCSPLAKCTNNAGGYECDCLPGYTGDGRTCKDEDECDGNPCGANADCKNLDGTYECTCKEGFEGSPYDGCTNINECVEGEPCDENAACEDETGSYTCTCLEGFTGDGETCTPVPTTPKPRTTTPTPPPTTPKPRTTTPRPAPTTPKPRTTTPRPAPTTPKPRATTPRPAPTTPKPRATTPRPAPTTPKPRATTPRPAPTTPKPRATTPRPAAGGKTTTPGSAGPDSTDVCECTVRGDPLVVTTDGDLMLIEGTNLYTLLTAPNCINVRVKVTEVDNRRIPEYLEVIAGAKKYRLYSNKAVRADTGNTLDLSSAFTDNANDLTISSTSEGIRLEKGCGATIVIGGVGLETSGKVTLTPKSNFQGKLTGMCGNCDGNRDNDLPNYPETDPRRYIKMSDDFTVGPSRQKP